MKPTATSLSPSVVTESEWYSLTLEDLARMLRADFTKGLDPKEAEWRLGEYGANKLPRGKRLPWWQLILNQFKNPLVFILIIAAVLTLWLREFLDTTVILLAVFVNSIIGFFQDYRSNKIFEKLQALAKVEARIIRGGATFDVDSEFVVPGDIILLRQGAKIPADARLISAKNLEVNEAPLTGESTPVKKDAKNLLGKIALADRVNMVHTGTTIESGGGVAVVVGTGASTELGRIAGLAAGIGEETTPLQERLTRLGRIIALVVFTAAVVIFVVGALEKRGFIQMFTIAVAVAVAAIPEGLPAALSVVLAVAAQKIFRAKGLVKKIIAAETLGSATVIVTDKTGTLTEGRMKVEEIIGTYDKNRAGLILALANEAIVVIGENRKKEVHGDGTDKAKLEFFLEQGRDIDYALGELPRVGFLPFDADEKYIASFHQTRDGALKVFVTGAPERLLTRSRVSAADQAKTLKTIEERASSGFRTIGIAERTLAGDHGINFEDDAVLKSFIKDLTFVGMATLRDPIREDVYESIEEARSAGIRVIMVTGDHRLTAMAIGKELKFRAEPSSIMTGEELDEMSDEKLFERIGELDIFARTSPKHKIRIIEALKKKGEVAAMTGDGINDAPALKAADIGIALGGGTDIAKEASDLVLLDDSFTVITAAIRHGRVAFDNIRKVAVFLLSNSFTELIIVMSSLALGLPLPITAVQILWANLVEDGLPNFALAFEPGEKTVMQRKPFRRREPIIDREGTILIFVVGILRDLIMVGVFLSFYFLSGQPLEYVRTLVFALLATDSLIYVFSMKSLRDSIFKITLFDNWYLLLAVAAGFVIMAAAIYAPPLQLLLGTLPLSGKHVVLVLGLGLMNIVFVELIKWWFRKVEPNALLSQART